MSLRAINSNESMPAFSLRAAFSFHGHPVILCLLLTICLDTCLAESLLQSQQLLLDVKIATAENDLASYNLADEILAGQIRIASIGSRADEMLTQMTVEALTQWRSEPSSRSEVPDIASLIYLVTYDPRSPQLLLDPLMSWVDAAASGKIQNGADITQRAALYINKWGTQEQKDRVKADTESMLRSSDYQTRAGGEQIQYGLKGFEVARVPRVLGVPFSDYCSWAASYAQHIRSGEPLPPVEVRSRWRLEPDKLIKPPIIAKAPSIAPLANQKNSNWFIVTFAVLALLGGVGWIMLRRRTHRP